MRATTDNEEEPNKHVNKQETKYAATARKMDEALLELLGERELPYITVKEICKRAGVNRSTFYLHYETIDDLLSECVESMNARFLEYFEGKREMLAQRLESGPESQLYFVTREYLEPYLRFIRENKKLFRTAMANPCVFRTQRTYDRMFRHVFEPAMRRFGVPEQDRSYLARFYVHGIMAIIAQWLDGDCAEGIEHIASIIEKCTVAPQTNNE